MKTVKTRAFREHKLCHSRPLHCHPVESEHISYKMPYLRSLLQCRPPDDGNILYSKKCPSPSIKESKNVILDPHLKADVDVIAPFLTDLFNKSLSTALFRKFSKLRTLRHC